MSKFVAQLQLARLERRTIQAIFWFVITGALLYLTVVCCRQPKTDHLRML
jgi:hypothetical protein